MPSTGKDVCKKSKEVLQEDANTRNILTNLTTEEIEDVHIQDESEKEDILEDVPIFTGDDSEPENFLPTFSIHAMNECLSLWTTDVEDYMYEINSEMRLSDKFNGPIVQQDAVQRTKKIARHKLIVGYKNASQIITENAPR